MQSTELFHNPSVDVSEVIFDTAGRRIVTARPPAPAARPPYSVLSTSKYESIGGPKLRPWEEALADYLGLRAQLLQPAKGKE